MLAFAMVLMLFAVVAKSIAGALAAGTAVFGAGLLIYWVIPPFSAFAALRFVNPVGIMQLNSILSIYKNYEFFGVPINLFWIAGTYLALSIVCFAGGGVYAFARLKSLVAEPFFLARLFKGLKKAGYRPSASLYCHEAYKLFIKQRVALLFLVFCAFLAALAPLYSNRLPVEELQYRSYMRQWEGPITMQTLVAIEKEQVRMEQAQKKIVFYDEQVALGVIGAQAAQEVLAPCYALLARQPAFERVKSQVQALQAQPNGILVYDTGLKALLNESASLQTVTLLLLAYVLAFFGGFSGEYTSGAQKLLGCTPLGRSKTVKAKLLVCTGAAALFWLAVQIPPALRMYQTYGPANIGPAVGNLPQFTTLPAFLPIWLVLLLHYGAQLLASVMLSLLILWLSHWLKKSEIVLAVCGGLLLGPLALTAMGLAFMRRVSALPLYSMAQCHQSGMGSWEFYLPFSLLSMGAFCAVFYLYSCFGESWAKGR